MAHRDGQSERSLHFDECHCNANHVGQAAITVDGAVNGFGGDPRGT